MYLLDWLQLEIPNTLPLGKAHPKLGFVPHDMNRAGTQPVQPLVNKRHVVSPAQFGESQVHFHPREAERRKETPINYLGLSIIGFWDCKKNLLATKTAPAAERERLARFFDVFAVRVQPALWFELHWLVKVFRIVSDGPGACVHFGLWGEKVRMSSSS